MFLCIVLLKNMIFGLVKLVIIRWNCSSFTSDRSMRLLMRMTLSHERTSLAPTILCPACRVPTVATT